VTGYLSRALRWAYRAPQRRIRAKGLPQSAPPAGCLPVHSRPETAPGNAVIKSWQSILEFELRLAVQAQVHATMSVCVGSATHGEGVPVQSFVRDLTALKQVYETPRCLSIILCRRGSVMTGRG
jgi:hypothetical protein